ncbi:MAG: MarR family transcriptional regulator [Bacteroidetes bacterium HGW-Bacteroidetes-1]|jgi:DNA-binding MarR family transcriptional regulator|nr:MAG: MarR family transcriptional regulator [Bacteroidetes bacterium HGW-Bacteroidetes-1]
MDTKEKVLYTLKQSTEPLRPGDIADVAGIDKKDVEKAIKVLKDQELIFSPKRCFYQSK